eukprot:gene4653-9720_t
MAARLGGGWLDERRSDERGWHAVAARDVPPGRRAGGPFAPRPARSSPARLVEGAAPPPPAPAGAELMREEPLCVAPAAGLPVCCVCLRPHHTECRGGCGLRI